MSNTPLLLCHKSQHISRIYVGRQLSKCAVAINTRIRTRAGMKKNRSLATPLSPKDHETCPIDHFSWAAIIRCSSRSCQLKVKERRARLLPPEGTLLESESTPPLTILLGKSPLQPNPSSENRAITTKHVNFKAIKSGPSIPSLSGTTISTVPEELRQQIISYLDYNDAFSLKQTSRLFLQVVEIPTIKSFLSRPYGPSLGMLEDWEIIPIGYEACWYCRRLLSASKFSRFQRRLTSARQVSLDFDYESWRPEKHSCIECGLKRGCYPRGQRIFNGYGDPGCADEAVIPCLFCGTLFDCDDLYCEDLPICEGCIGVARLAREKGVALAFPLERMACDQEAIVETCRSLGVVADAFATPDGEAGEVGEVGELKNEAEPHPEVYDDYWPEVMLSLIGEKMIPRDA